MRIYIPSIDNRDILCRYLRYNKIRMCELNPVNSILWSRHYDTGFFIIEDMLVFCRLADNKPVSFSFPVGDGDARRAFDAVTDICAGSESEPEFYMISSEQFSMIDSWYGGEYEIEYYRDGADYLYEADSLASLAGKKLHGKRNHINRFLEQYPDYRYENIDDNNCEECLFLAYEWSRLNGEADNSEAGGDVEYEKCALRFALENRTALGMRGALIRAEGRVVAFTLGSQLTEDTFDVNFEKAYADVQGAYAIINREFVKRELLGRYKYVNREEDMGLSGLRHAKTSYQPICLVEKGRVTKRSVSK